MICEVAHNSKTIRSTSKTTETLEPRRRLREAPGPRALPVLWGTTVPAGKVSKGSGIPGRENQPRWAVAQPYLPGPNSIDLPAQRYP